MKRALSLADIGPAFDVIAGPVNNALTAAGLEVATASLLTERSDFMTLQTPGQVSANGSCRLVQALDGWIAINLARVEDHDLLPAWLEVEAAPDPQGQAFADMIRRRPAAHWVAQGSLLGLAVPSLDEAGLTRALICTRLSPTQAPQRSPRVVDLSSLWAGPLCSHILHRLGAQVTKVESLSRPDGGRTGSPAFFDRLNHGKAQSSLDFKSHKDIARLRSLILNANVVIEASRPRALRSLGLDAETLLPLKPGQVWVAITAHGREGEAGDRIGYGDDAAVAGGLVGRDAAGAPQFLGDAIADPLTGIHAAGAVIEALKNGGGVLLDIALAGVSAMTARLARGQAMRLA